LLQLYRYEYDLYVYQEDDQLFTAQHLRTFLEEDEALQKLGTQTGGYDNSGTDAVRDMIPGFFRFEYNPAHLKKIQAEQAEHGPSTKKIANASSLVEAIWVNFNTEKGALPPFTIVGGEPYFSCKPPVWCYSGGMVATQRHLQQFLNSRQYFSRTMGR
jgi:hypothetical protein